MVSGRSSTESPDRWETCPSRKHFCLQLSFLGNWRKSPQFPPPSRPAHPPETSDNWEKGSGCKPPQVLALTVAFIFNEPVSWDLTRRQQALFAASRSPEQGCKWLRFLSSVLPRLGFAQPLGMKEPSVEDMVTVGIIASLVLFWAVKAYVTIYMGNALKNTN